jgi:hypothetical protein
MQLTTSQDKEVKKHMRVADRKIKKEELERAFGKDNITFKDAGDETFTARIRTVTNEYLFLYMNERGDILSSSDTPKINIGNNINVVIGPQ